MEDSPIKCVPRYLSCDTLDDDDRIKWENSTAVFNNCNPNNSSSFNYGLFANAMTNNVVSSVFVEKYFYCLWWGLQNLRYNSRTCYSNHIHHFYFQFKGCYDT